MIGPEIARAVSIALTEDIGHGDATSLPIIPVDHRVHGTLLCKAQGIVAGLDVAREVFRQVDATIAFCPTVVDGQRVAAGDVLGSVTGRGPGILVAERVALNFLQRMSGIASLTRQYVDAVAGTGARILDTRKTAPGLRALDKLAVAIGGGCNHRIGLYDMVLIKDNHIAAAGSIAAAVERVRESRFRMLPIEVEVTTLAELEQVLPLRVDRVMLDNMDLDTMRHAVAMVDGATELEASGGIDIDSVADVAATGVHWISVGALTHSVRALDISLELQVGESEVGDASA